MDKSFIKYVKDKKNLSLVILALAFGILLIFIGSRDEEQAVSAVGMEERLATACSEVDGVGECEIMIYYSDKDGKVESVIVICDGADSVEVRAELTSMISAFFGIGTNRVRILRRAWEDTKQ